jgi:LysM repeat protein
MAANPGMKIPTGKVFVPMNQMPGNRVTATSYTRPVGGPAAVPSNVKVVKAQSGDTVSKVATRHGADPTDVAKYNGLLVNSVLHAGREIKIPAN